MSTLTKTVSVTRCFTIQLILKHITGIVRSKIVDTKMEYHGYHTYMFRNCAFFIIEFSDHMMMKKIT